MVHVCVPFVNQLPRKFTIEVLRRQHMHQNCLLIVVLLVDGSGVETNERVKCLVIVVLRSEHDWGLSLTVAHVCSFLWVQFFENVP